MAITTIEFVDTDLSTVLFDLHSSTGSTNSSWGSVITKFGLGGNLTTTAPHDAERFEHPGADGGFTTFSRRGLGEAKWRQVIAGSTEANLRLGVGRLTDLITRGTILRIVTGTTTRYLRLEPSGYPSPYQGKELELHDIFQQFSFRQGLDIAAACQPYWEGAEVTGSAVTVPNDPATSTKVRVYPITVTGDLPTPAKVRATMDAGSAVERILIANRGPLSSSQAADYLSDTGYLNCEATGRNWTVTLGTNTTSTADATASGGNTARCTHTTDPTIYARRVRATRTANIPSLRGSWDVWLRVKGHEADEYRLQLKWGPSTADPAAFALPEVVHDLATGPATSFGYVELNMGRIHIPETVALGGLAFEIWTRNVGADTSNLDMDFLWLVPSEAQGTVVVPGGSSTTWLGDEMVTPSGITADPAWAAGAVVGTAMRLNANNEAAGTPPAAGFDPSDGRHRVGFRYTFNSFVGAASVRITNETDNTETFESIGDDGSGPRFFVAEYDAVAAKSYLYAVNITSYTSGSVDVVQITDEFLPSLASGEAARTEPGPRRYAVDRLDGSANLAGYLGVEGAVPAVLVPGVNHVMVRADETRLNGNPENENDLARVPTVTVSYFPRFAL